MKNELQRLVEGPKVNIFLDSQKATVKNTKLENNQAMMAYMDPGRKI